MMRRGYLALSAALSAGCTLGLDWTLPVAPGLDAALDSGQPSLDVDDATAPEVWVDADDAHLDADHDAEADGHSADGGDASAADDAPDGEGVDVPACACPEGEACVDGACVRPCPSGQTRCGAACFDLTQNVQHCGACGVTCRPGWRCCAGVCMMRCN